MQLIRRMRAYGARPLLLGAALLGIVVVAGLAAMESHRSFVARKATAERTVRDYAMFAAYLYSTRIYLFALQRSNSAFAAFHPQDPYRGRSELPPLSAIPAIPDTMEQCGNNWSIYRFRLDLPSHNVQYLGGRPSPSIERIIRDSLPQLADSRWLKRFGFGYLFVDPPAAPREAISYVPAVDSTGQLLAVYGYRSCYGVRDTSDYSRMYQIVKVLPPMIPGYQEDTSGSEVPPTWRKTEAAQSGRAASAKSSRPISVRAAELMRGRWPNGMPADSLLTLTIFDEQKRIVYQAPANGHSSDLYGGAPVGYIGGVWVQVSLRPDVTRFLVAGGIPGSRLPASLLLFAAAIALAIAGFASLRSEVRLVRSRERFLANVSHELRTPLQQILLFVQLIRLGRTRSEAEKEKSLEIIERETNRLIALSNSVLTATSKPELQLESSPVDVAGVAQTAADFFTPLAEARKMRIELDVEQPAVARGDPGAIRQILINVLDNAAKYGPTGQTIRIGVRNDGPVIRLWVDDRGPGIPAHQRNNVWKPFVRLGGTVDDSTGGAGLGLAIVRDLAAAMDANAELSDVPGGGTRFSLSLHANQNGNGAHR